MRKKIVGYLLAFVASHATVVQSQVQTLGEAEVLKIALREHPMVDVSKAASALIEARATQAALYPNPTVAWNRAVFLGDGAEREESIAATVPIDLSARRATGANIARAAGGATLSSALREKNGSIASVLSVFYELVAQRERIAALERADAVLSEVSRVATRRVEEGQAARYEAHRLAIEAQLVRSQLLQGRVDEARMHFVLATWLGLQPKDVRFEGALEVTQSRAGDADVSERASLRVIRQAARDASEAYDDASWAWIPTINLVGGLRLGEESDQSLLGYVAGVSLALPLFSRGQGLSAQANALAKRTRGQAERLRRQYEVAVEQQRLLLRFATSELSRFDSETSTLAKQLEDAARARYEEGEGAMVALVDARRAITEVELRRVGLRLRAKQAEVGLRQAKGEFE